ncbi:MAG TPA: M6 family metalloprotease domain-containing protein [Thermoanaerobaculaceae bacterium]|nr:M6 family metalloprotease domain-containing protein [Thermoanaerobaculaceae bacterium]
MVRLAVLRTYFLRSLVALAVIASAATVRAAFLRNVPQALRQPDGTVVHLFATGDEYYNRLHDAGGYTVVRDPDTGYLVYAIKVEGRLMPSAFVVGVDDPAAAGLRSGLMPEPWTLPSASQIYPSAGRRRAARAAGLVNAPEFTTINNIVIFISFADDSGSPFNTLDTYQMWFNSITSTSSSMQKYFLEASYNQLTVNSTFYPAATGATVASYQDSHPRAYYTPYNAVSNPTGYQGSERNGREWALLQAAVQAVGSQVPASLNVDTNGDGFVDSVVFVVSGTAVNADWSNLLWPHKWEMDTANYPATINGKLVGEYDLQLDGNITGSGVLCHEMTHTLGAPDLYHYSEAGEPVGPWDLMADNLEPPQHTTAYLKARYLGFLSGCPVITPPATVTLNPLTSPTNNCARILSPNSTTEYFMVEYRKRAGTFEVSLKGSGLLVYRINTAEDGQGNSSGPPDEVYVYRPGGTPSADGTINWAPLNGGATPPRTAINDASDPSSFLSNGYPGGLSIHDVGAPGDTITFKVDSVAPCSRPGLFTLASPANGANLSATTSANLAWNASAGATSYDVYFGTAEDPPLLANQTATSASVTVASGSTYFWRVVAKNGCSELSAPGTGAWAFSVGSTGNGITIFSDDFEADLSKWTLGNTSGASPTNWGIVSCRTESGHGSAWCAAGGSAPKPACTQYAANEGAFMIAGPFSLADAVDGTWEFDLWTDVDQGSDPNNPNDWVLWMWSLDGNNFYGNGTSGQTGGWQHIALNLSDMKMGDGTPVVGMGQVWFAYLFLSDATIQREGAYVDNVVIKKLVAGQPNFDHWIPAVIHKDVPSRNAWWRSDVAAINRSPVPGTLTLKMYAPSGVKTMTVPLAGNAQALLRDVAARLGVTTDSGALEVVSDVDVFLTGRTYSQVDPTHTYGQGYDGTAPTDVLAAGQTAWLPQLTQNALFRTNVGIANTSTASANVTVTLFDAQGNQVWTDTRDYTPGQFYQHDFSKLLTAAMDLGYAVVVVNSGSGVVAVASVIDQQTGDPTTINMKTGAPGASGPFAYWLPAVSHKPGYNQSQWRSDVAILNRTTQTANVTLKIYTATPATAGPFHIPANSELVFKDVAAQLGITNDSGALEVDSDRDIFLTGRTYNQADATHTYGQGYDGIATADVLAAGQTAWLPQLSQNALFRTNVGIANTSTANANVTVTLYDATGKQLWSDNRDYASGRFYQHEFSKIPAAATDSGYAVVTVNSGEGVVAVASVIDQQTGDPTTINMKR